MSQINVVSRTQRIIVDPASSGVSVINVGPQGPGGPIGVTGPHVPIVELTQAAYDALPPPGVANTFYVIVP